jgi:periplasmic divalent cation tolerance protein
MKANWVYMTAASKDEATRIGRELVSARLAACVNIIEPMNSIYRWEGKIEEAAEVVLIAKTLESRVPQLIETVKSMHSYSCPCIISLPIEAGNPAYLEWIKAEVQ